MTVAVPDALAAEIVAVLRGTGARFGLLHGSRAAGSPRAESAVDVAAWWLSDPPPAFEVLLPPGVDLVVLNGAPLELAGRIALHGRVLFDDDPSARVRWTATTRKIYADEQSRMRRSTTSSPRPSDVVDEVRGGLPERARARLCRRVRTLPSPADL